MQITTDRILIRTFSASDAPFILKLVNTPTWLQFIGQRHVNTLEDAQRYLNAWAFDSYQKHGFGPYLVVNAATHKALGTCGLFKRESLEHPDLGFAFAPEHTQQGFAKEAAQLVINYAFEVLKLPKILAITNHNNVSSIKLLNKLGFNEIDFTYDPQSKVFELVKGASL